MHWLTVLLFLLAIQITDATAITTRSESISAAVQGMFTFSLTCCIFYGVPFSWSLQLKSTTSNMKGSSTSEKWWSTSWMHSWSFTERWVQRLNKVSVCPVPNGVQPPSCRSFANWKKPDRNTMMEQICKIGCSLSLPTQYLPHTHELMLCDSPNKPAACLPFSPQYCTFTHAHQVKLVFFLNILAIIYVALVVTYTIRPYISMWLHLIVFFCLYTLSCEFCHSYIIGWECLGRGYCGILMGVAGTCTA